MQQPLGKIQTPSNGRNLDAKCCHRCVGKRSLWCSLWQRGRVDTSVLDCSQQGVDREVAACMPCKSAILLLGVYGRDSDRPRSGAWTQLLQRWELEVAGAHHEDSSYHAAVDTKCVGSRRSMFGKRDAGRPCPSPFPVPCKAQITSLKLAVKVYFLIWMLFYARLIPEADHQCPAIKSPLWLT